MVFEYTVKHNGKKYLPGEDVPLDKETPTPTNEVKPEKSTLEQAKEVFEQKAVETSKKSKGGRKPKQ